MKKYDAAELLNIKFDEILAQPNIFTFLGGIILGHFLFFLSFYRPKSRHHISIAPGHCLFYLEHNENAVTLGQHGLKNLPFFSQQTEMFFLKRNHRGKD